jgi:hypothetical protein
MSTTLQAWYYFCFGLTLASYLFVLFRKKDKDGPAVPPPTPGNNNTSPAPVRRIYLNLFFIDRTEFIHNIIRSKVPRSRPLIRALAKRAAVALLKDGIVNKVSQGLCKSLQERMEVMGVKCSVNLVYNQAAYAALELSFHTVDLHQFFLFGAGEEKAKGITNFLNRYSLPAITEFFKKFLLGVVFGKLMVQLPTTIKEKLYNKMNTAIEVVSCSEEEQGPFFVQTLGQLNEKESSKDASKQDSLKEVSSRSGTTDISSTSPKERAVNSSPAVNHYAMKQSRGKDSDDDDVTF